jgi:integrase
MNLEPYDERDGMKVWLSREETDAVIDAAADDARTLVELGLRCGLRCSEAVNVAPKHVVETGIGPTLRVVEEVAKLGKYREVPLPADLSGRIEAVDRVRDAPADEPVVEFSQRTADRRVAQLRQQLADETGDDHWRHLEFHDFRRTWATLLAGREEVDPLVVCDWGGWEKLDTFLEHYRGAFSPEVQRRERDAVDWL